MSVFNNFSSRFTAAASALALSIMLFTNTLTVPQPQLAASSFVGALA